MGIVEKKCPGSTGCLPITSLAFESLEEALSGREGSGGDGGKSPIGEESSWSTSSCDEGDDSTEESTEEEDDEGLEAEYGMLVPKKRRRQRDERER